MANLHWQWDDLAEGTPVAWIDLTFDFHRDDGIWVGVCKELSTSTYGRNRKRVHKSLKALVIEHLNLLEETAERGRFFDEWGIVLRIPPAPRRGHKPPPPFEHPWQELVIGTESELMVTPE